MKEYLTKNMHGKYQLVNHRFSEDDIEVPEGANYAATNGHGVFFSDKNDFIPDLVVWVRESLNDKVASAEVARQKHSHYKKDVSHLKSIDVYRVLNLFNVEGHEVGHAIKKLLCSGQRGAKDHKQDTQEAIDSLNRHLEMLAEDEAS